MSSSIENLHDAGYDAYQVESKERSAVYLGFFLEGKLVEGRSVMLTEGPNIAERMPINARAFLFARTLSWYLNLGGSVSEAQSMLAQCEAIGELSVPGAVLFDVLASEEAPIAIWKLENGNFIKVVPGCEGFTETLTPDELAEWLGEE